MRSNYCAVASRVLFLWDYLITVEDEVEYFWERKITTASVLFLLNRYVNLAITVLQFFAVSSFQTAQCASCGAFVRVIQTLLALACTISGVFAAIRVYAIWQRSCLIALPVLMLAMVPPVLTIYIDAHQTPALAPAPSSGCAIIVGLTLTQYTICMPIKNELLYSLAYLNSRCYYYAKLHYSLRCACLCLDCRTDLAARERQPSKDWPGEIDHTGWLSIFRVRFKALLSGTIAHLRRRCLTLLNTAQLVLTFTSEDINYPSYFVSPLTSILISRLLLNLRKAAQASLGMMADTSLYLSSGSPSVESSSDIFFDMSSDLKEVSLLYSDTLRSHGTSSQKDIESRSSKPGSEVDPSI
ncbi:hypothetical protein BC629DRAFT_1586818 [Irpex lacteus]|nr:hypothetical protein BC629DRAFT_1586818 [Irpex lacteus]